MVVLCCFSGGKSASEGRCNVLLREATQFMGHLKKAEKHLKELDKTAEVMLKVSKEVMEAPLPRQIYDETGCQAERPVETIGGEGFHGEDVFKIKVELDQHITAEVFNPLQQWGSGYNTAVGQQKAVDKLYKGMESWRHKVEAQKAKVDKLRAKHGAEGGSPARAKQFEEATKALQISEGQLSVAANRHDEEEAQQYIRLTELIRDAVYLRRFIKLALGQVGKALVDVSDSVEIFPTANQADAPHLLADGTMAPERMTTMGRLPKSSQPEASIDTDPQPALSQLATTVEETPSTAATDSPPPTPKAEPALVAPAPPTIKLASTSEEPVEAGGLHPLTP